MTPRKVAAFAIGPVGGAIIGLATIPTLTWIYPPEDIARITMTQVATSFFLLLFTLGLDQAYVREYHESTDHSALLKSTIAPGLLLSLTAATILLANQNLLSEILFEINSQTLSIFAALCFAAAFTSRFLSLILRMQENGLAYSTSQVLPKATFLLLILSCTLIFKKPDTTTLIAAHTLSILLAMFILAWNTKGVWIPSIRAKIDTKKQIAMLKFGSPLILSGLAFWILTATDKIFLRTYSNLEELGIYSVAVSFAGAAIILQSVFSTVWAPVVYRWAAEGVNPEKIDEVTDHLLTAIVMAFSLSGLFSWTLKYILPEKYADVQYIVVACMAYPLLYTLSEATMVGITIKRKTSYAMLAASIAASINITANYLLIPALGAKGASLSLAISFWAFLLLRTELSILAWRKIPRRGLYLKTSACLAATILFTLKGSEHREISFIIWLALMTTIAPEAKKIYRSMKARKTQKNLE